MRLLGPWTAYGDPAAARAMWWSPDPLHEGQRIYYSETFRLYNNDDDEPIYFSGTDLRNASLGQPAGGCNILVAARGGGARARRGAVERGMITHGAGVRRATSSLLGYE